MRAWHAWALPAVWCLFGWWACAGSKQQAEADAGLEVDVPSGLLSTEEVYERLKPSCEACHASGVATSSFESLASFVALIVEDPSLVMPGEPENSRLIDLLVGEAGPGYVQMPPTGPSFADMEAAGDTQITVDEVRAWVAALPPNQPSGPACVPGEIQLGESPIRRLNVAEFRNTVRDLFDIPETFDPAEGFLADPILLGFDNQAVGLVVTEDIAYQYLIAAEKIAEVVVAGLISNPPCTPGQTLDDCVIAVIEDYGLRAFRRPLEPEERDRFKATMDWGIADSGGDIRVGAQLMFQQMLQSPHFLYRVEFGLPDDDGDGVVKLTGYEIATRLSFFLWNSMPDAALFEAAADGSLDKVEGVRLHAERMLEDPKARVAIEHFHDLWLEIDRVEALDKGDEVFDGWGEDIKHALVANTRAFVEATVFGGGTLQDLLGATGTVYMNEATAGLYGVEGVVGELPRPVAVDGTRRAGLLTDPAILAGQALYAESSPVHRGLWVRKRLLCQEPPAPPDDVEILIPEPNPDQTTRERYAVHSENQPCAGCHANIDMVGFLFEHYDAVGRWRDTENGKPIDATGVVYDTSLSDVPLDGAVELTEALRDAPEVQACAVRQWFRWAHGRDEGTDDSCTLEQLDEAFASGQFRITDLIVAITVSDAFRMRRIVQPQEACP